MSLCILASSYPANPGESNNAGVFVRDFARACEVLSPGCTVFTHRKGAPGDYREKFSVIEYGWMGKDTSLTSVNLRSIAGMIKACSLLLKGSLGYIRLCRRGQISHSLAMWAFPSGFYALLAKKLYGVPYSVWALGSDIWRYEKHPLIGPLLRMVLRNADHLFADGMEFAETVAAISGGECSFLPSTRSLGQIEALPVKNTSPRPRFLYVGRYEYNKGPDILLEAAREYFARGGGGSFHLFGEGSFRKQMDSYVSDYAMTTRVSIHDIMGAEELVGRLKWCDYLIIPSRIESIPVILSDAMQMGTPIIATEVGDIPAICRELDCAITVPPEEPVKLAEILLNCCGVDRKNANLRPGLRAPLTSPTETAGRFLHCAGLLKRGYQEEARTQAADF